MAKLIRILAATIITGTVASATTTAALALLARSQGRSAVQPINATSHWLHGNDAGSVDAADLSHTGLGYATHHASALFWALPFEAWLASRRHNTPATIARDACVMAAVAATVDYGMVPRRLSPGWEIVLPTSSIAAVFGTLALGLAAGALTSRRILGNQLE